MNGLKIILLRVHLQADRCNIFLFSLELGRMDDKWAGSLPFAYLKEKKKSRWVKKSHVGDNATINISGINFLQVCLLRHEIIDDSSVQCAVHKPVLYRFYFSLYHLAHFATQEKENYFTDTRDMEIIKTELSYSH